MLEKYDRILSSGWMNEHRLEYLRPDQIRDNLRSSPFIYVPVGAVEWHGHHDVVGLDGLKPHGQLLRVAGQVGGVVYPPIYTGTFTGNKGDPHTFMIGQGTLIALLQDLLGGFENDGYEKAVLLCGHYPNYLFAVKALVQAWDASNRPLKVLALIESQLSGVRGDHAGRSETSAMLDLAPATVDLERIGGASQAEGDDTQEHDWLGTPADHPCHGVVGVDPRHSTAQFGRDLNDRVVDAIAQWIKTGEIRREWE